MKKSLLIKCLLGITAFFVLFLFSCNASPTNVETQTNSSSEQIQSSSEKELCTHVYGNWIVNEEATCKYDGYKERFCTLCEKKDACVLEALGHTPGEMLRSEPDCLHEGLAVQCCTRCTETLHYEVLPKSTTHEPTITKTTRTPTCTTTGHAYKYCPCAKEFANVIIPSFGGHTDRNGDLVCDTCKEALYSIPVYLQFQGNATATTNDYVLISEEHGGIITVTMGKNSIYYESYTLFAPPSNAPDFLAGNVLHHILTHVRSSEASALTGTYQHHVQIDSAFGFPKEVTLTIADTTQTAVVFFEMFMSSEKGTGKYSSDTMLYWGTLVDPNDDNAMNNPDNKVNITASEILGYYKFTHYADENDVTISEEKTIELILTQPITYLRGYYQLISDTEQETDHSSTKL